MASVTRLVLDVLKPHQPNPLDFAANIADLDSGYQVNLLVEEVDDKTQSIVLSITGGRLDFVTISSMIESMGGSIHSIDEVDVTGETAEKHEES